MRRKRKRIENLDTLAIWGWLMEIKEFCHLRRSIIPQTAVWVYKCPLCGKEFEDIDNRTWYEFEKKCRKHISKGYWYRYSKRVITMKFIMTKIKIAKMTISYND